MPEVVKELYKGKTQTDTVLLQNNNKTTCFISNVFLTQLENAGSLSLTINDQPITPPIGMQYGDIKQIEANMVLAPNDKLGVTITTKENLEFIEKLKLVIASGGGSFLVAGNGMVAFNKDGKFRIQFYHQVGTTTYAYEADDAKVEDDVIQYDEYIIFKENGKNRIFSKSRASIVDSDATIYNLSDMYLFYYTDGSRVTLYNKADGREIYNLTGSGLKVELVDKLLTIYDNTTFRIYNIQSKTLIKTISNFSDFYKFRDGDWLIYVSEYDNKIFAIKDTSIITAEIPSTYKICTVRIICEDVFFIYTTYGTSYYTTFFTKNGSSLKKLETNKQLNPFLDIDVRLNTSNLFSLQTVIINRSNQYLLSYFKDTDELVFNNYCCYVGNVNNSIFYTRQSIGICKDTSSGGSLIKNQQVGTGGIENIINLPTKLDLGNDNYVFIFNSSENSYYANSQFVFLFVDGRNNTANSIVMSHRISSILSNSRYYQCQNFRVIERNNIYYVFYNDGNSVKYVMVKKHQTSLPSSVSDFPELFISGVASSYRMKNIFKYNSEYYIYLNNNKLYKINFHGNNYINSISEITDNSNNTGAYYGFAIDRNYVYYYISSNKKIKGTISGTAFVKSGEDNIDISNYNFDESIYLPEVGKSVQFVFNVSNCYITDSHSFVNCTMKSDNSNNIVFGTGQETLQYKYSQNSNCHIYNFGLFYVVFDKTSKNMFVTRDINNLYKAGNIYYLNSNNRRVLYDYKKYSNSDSIYLAVKKGKYLYILNSSNYLSIFDIENDYNRIFNSTESFTYSHNTEKFLNINSNTLYSISLGTSTKIADKTFNSTEITGISIYTVFGDYIYGIESSYKSGENINSNNDYSSYYKMSFYNLKTGAFDYIWVNTSYKPDYIINKTDSIIIYVRESYIYTETIKTGALPERRKYINGSGSSQSNIYILNFRNYFYITNGGSFYVLPLGLVNTSYKHYILISQNSNSSSNQLTPSLFIDIDNEIYICDNEFNTFVYTKSNGVLTEVYPDTTNTLTTTPKLTFDKDTIDKISTTSKTKGNVFIKVDGVEITKPED